MMDARLHDDGESQKSIGDLSFSLGRQERNGRPSGLLALMRSPDTESNHDTICGRSVSLHELRRNKGLKFE